MKGRAAPARSCSRARVHALSPRADGPFVAINCAAIPETLLETELFGHEKGAFTGASQRKPGKFELAHRGTLFLDEIGDLPLTLQAKILRALEEKQFERVGGTDARCTSTCASSPPPTAICKAAVAARQYREDLYFRLSVFPLTVPPLRERPGDIPLLAQLLRRSLLPRAAKEAARAVARCRRRNAWRTPGAVTCANCRTAWSVR